MDKFSVDTFILDCGSVGVEFNVYSLNGHVGRLHMVVVDTEQIRAWEQHHVVFAKHGKLLSSEEFS